MKLQALFTAGVGSRAESHRDRIDELVEIIRKASSVSDD
jgi:hypothetical protein